MLNVEVATTWNGLFVRSTVPVTGWVCTIFTVAVTSGTMPASLSVSLAGGSAIVPVSVAVFRSIEPLNAPGGTVTVWFSFFRCVVASIRYENGTIVSADAAGGVTANHSTGNASRKAA